MAFEITFKRYIREARAEETRRIKIDGTILNVGTGAGNEVQLEGIGVAINHATIEKTSDDQYQLTDLNTPDGTYVNNNLISKKIPLNDGDEIKIGKYSIVIKFPASGEDPAKVSVTEVYAEEEETVEEIKKPKEEKVELVSRFKLSKSALNKTSLSIFGLVILVVLIVYWIVDRDTEAFSPGKLSDAHTKFNKQCVKCHTVAWNIVPDNSCNECHKEAKAHNENELFTPPCLSCHHEHKGNFVLSAVENDACTQCHSGLLIKGYVPSDTYHRHITDFASNHPEFAVLVNSLDENGNKIRVRLSDKKNLIDHTPIKLNHKVHLKPNLRGPEGPEKLTCDRCHEVDAEGRYMLPINYERHCTRCHTLEFDLRFGGAVVPHEATDKVREYLEKSYAGYAVNNSRRLGLEGNTRSINQWISLRVKESEDVLYRKKKCAECHFFEENTQYSELPIVVEPKIPKRWFTHGKFDHKVHGQNLHLSCQQCHSDVETSERTTDVLMPSINVCLKCHSRTAGAKTECANCHQYHQRGKEREKIRTKTIKDILDSR